MTQSFTSFPIWNYLLNYVASREIKIPTKFHEQCIAVDEMLKNDVSGLVNSLLDFAVSCGSVKFSIETSNSNLTTTFNNWLKNLNSSLLGRVPVGVDQLAKEYYRERWKRSSLIVLRSIWENVDGWYLPTKLWLADGGSIEITDNSKSAVLGSEQYKLKISKDDKINLPKTKNEKIFIQKPFESWGSEYPTPFLIKRGTYYNLEFLRLLSEKGSNFVGKAIEYLLLLKKGDKDLAKLGKPEFIYNENDLQALKDSLQKLVDEQRLTGGIPSMAANFDTEIDHLIPDYEKALKSANYAPIERRLLASLGFIEVIEGITTSRKDGVLNPKVFVSEVENGVNDFASLLKDILMTVIIENKAKKPKFTNEDYIEIRKTPVKQFMSQEAKDFLRSQYDRGLISKRTLIELGCDLDFDAEVERRKQETEQKLDEKMYPPIITNVEKDANADKVTPEQKMQDNLSPDKKSIEKKNFKNAGNQEVNIPDNLEENLHEIYINIFNQANLTLDEKKSHEFAFALVKKISKKQNKKYSLLDEYSELVTEENPVEAIANLKKIELAMKQSKLIDKILNNSMEDFTEEK
jgi:hypothetical protein